MFTFVPPPVTSLPPLCPAQQETLNNATTALSRSQFVSVFGPPGCGISTLLQHAHASLGGKILRAGDLFASHTEPRFPVLEKSLASLLTASLEEHDLLIIDDFDLLSAVVRSPQSTPYPRGSYLTLLIKAIFNAVEGTSKRFLFGRTSEVGLTPRTVHYKVRPFKPEDYTAICSNVLGAQRAKYLDFNRIFQYSPKLNAHQLRKACNWLSPGIDLTTDRFIEYLKSQQLASNVDTTNIASIQFSDLKGMDDLLLSLETNLVCPIENAAIASELQAKPKRGILLAGPPGTGKTSIGRALAHRLQSKFFLIDGTFLSGTPSFYRSVDAIFQAAAENAPSLIFIDDTDVIFEDGSETRFYRYLLTKLDGLESNDSGLVCIAMTAMNVAALPPALIRSGRIELWLQTKLPDEAGRAAILQSLTDKAPAPFDQIHVCRLASATEGFSGADLKRLLEDGKLLYAFDRSRGNHLREPTNYLLDAIDVVRENKQRHAEAESAARRRRPVRPPYFDQFDSGDFDTP